MAEYKVTDAELTYLADKIRAKGGTEELLEWPTGFGEAVDNITGDSSDINLQEKTVYSNGIVLPDSGYDGLSKVFVLLPDASALTEIAFLKVTVDTVDIAEVVVSKDNITYTPVKIDGNTAIYSLTALGTYIVNFGTHSLNVNIYAFYHIYECTETAPEAFVSGAYWVSYNKGDYARWSTYNRKIIRKLESGPPLLFGFARNSGGYICAAIASSVDLGDVEDVISGDYIAKRVGQFLDGSPMYLYGGYAGGDRSTWVKIYKADNTLAQEIDYRDYKITLPYPSSTTTVSARTSDSEALISQVEDAIRYYSPLI